VPDAGRCVGVPPYIAGRRIQQLERAKGGNEAMVDPGWQEMISLLASGAIGPLLVWGYQNLLKKK
jgi:hypothetical protein